VSIYPKFSFGNRHLYVDHIDLRIYAVVKNTNVAGWLLHYFLVVLPQKRLANACSRAVIQFLGMVLGWCSAYRLKEASAAEIRYIHIDRLNYRLGIIHKFHIIIDSYNHTTYYQTGQAQNIR